MEAEGTWEISVPSAQYCCELKTFLNIKSIKNNNEEETSVVEVELRKKNNEYEK